MFGRVLEYMGKQNVFEFLLLTAICAGIIQLLVEPSSPTIGASGAVFGLLAGFGTLFPILNYFCYFHQFQLKQNILL